MKLYFFEYSHRACIGKTKNKAEVVCSSCMESCYWLPMFSLLLMFLKLVLSLAWLSITSIELEIIIIMFCRFWAWTAFTGNLEISVWYLWWRACVLHGGKERSWRKARSKGTRWTAPAGSKSLLRRVAESASKQQNH